MRRDFRVKLDFSRIYRDARQNSWVFVDGAKIFRVHQLADHIQKLFDIERPFHLLARYEEVYCFLPFEEDVRVLENNDTVQIVPGTGIENDYESNKEPKKPADVNGSIKPQKQDDKELVSNSEKSFVSSMTVDNTSDIASVNGSFYKTAYPDNTFNETRDSEVPEDAITEENTEILDNTENGVVSNKRKRVRKRKQKKTADTLPESDTSFVEKSEKKPKIVDSIMSGSGKHIRFQDLDESNTSDNNTTKEEAAYAIQPNGHPTHLSSKRLPNADLSALMSLRQSSTPMTFTHKKNKRNFIAEVKNESDMVVEVNESGNTSSNLSNVSTSNISKQSQPISLNDTVSFKVLKMSEDYNPQVSSSIVGKVLQTSEDGSQYTLKIIHGKDQLKEPDGKFALPNNDEDLANNESNDVFLLEKSRLIDLSKITGL